MLRYYRIINRKIKNVDREAFAQKVSRSPDAKQILKDFKGKLEGYRVKNDMLIESDDLVSQEVELISDR